MAGMARVLARSCQTDIVSDSLDTLLDSCTRRLRYGDEAERVAASVVLNRVIVTVGPNRQDAYEALSGTLARGVLAAVVMMVVVVVLATVGSRAALILFIFFVRDGVALACKRVYN